MCGKTNVISQADVRVHSGPVTVFHRYRICFFAHGNLDRSSPVSVVPWERGAAKIGKDVADIGAGVASQINMHL